MTFKQSLRLGVALSLAMVPPVHGLEPQPRTLTEIDGPFRLTGKSLRVTLPDSSLARAALEQSNDNTLFVVVRGLRAPHGPVTSYVLYVDLPEGGSAAERELHRIGSLNFFGTTATRAQDDGNSNDWRSYDITAVARRLLALGRLSGPISISLEANGAPVVGSEATIGSIAIVRP